MRIIKIKELYDKSKMPTLNNYLELNGVKDVEDFLEPSGKYIEDFHLYEDIPYAVQELKFYCNLQEESTIYIIQDGDTDGICSAFILYDYLSHLSDKLNLRILLHTSKQRGLDDEDIMNEIRENRPNLVIIPDAATNNFTQAEELCELGIGLIVLDHHDYSTPIQKGVLVNNQNPLYKVQRNGSGALVTHKFLYGLDNEFGLNWASWYVDIVALSLVSDSMNMSEMENRTYYHFGLETRDCINNEFLGAMFDRFIGDKAYTQKDISFKIIPKCNAICRCQNQELKQRLLLAFMGMDNIEEVLDICEQAHKDQINKINEIVENNKEEIDKLSQNNLVFFASDDIPRSYSGLVAGKVMNLCNGKPTIVGSIKDDYFIGSLRSPIPLRSKLENNKLVDFASGHESSCGFGIDSNNIQPLINYYNTLNLSHEPCTSVIKSYPIKSIPKRLFSLFEPYNALWGHCIEQPLLHITLDYSPTEIKVMGKGQTTLKISQGGVDVVFFFMGAEKKEQLGLICEETTQVDPNSGEAIDLKQWCALDSNKRSLEVIGTFGINEYTSKYGKVYRTNQIIVDEFEVKKYKQKTLSDLL